MILVWVLSTIELPISNKKYWLSVENVKASSNSDFIWDKDIPEDNLPSFKLVKGRTIITVHSPIAVVEMAIAATPPPSYIGGEVIFDTTYSRKTYSIVQKYR